MVEFIEYQKALWTSQTCYLETSFLRKYSIFLTHQIFIHLVLRGELSKAGCRQKASRGDQQGSDQVARPQAALHKETSSGRSSAVLIAQGCTFQPCGFIGVDHRHQPL